MKLARLGTKGMEKPAIVDNAGNYRDLSSVIPDITGETLEDLTWVDGIDINSLPAIPAGTRIGPCVGKIGKLICVGLNYSDHAAETGNPIPKEPILFGKATSSIIGPNDNVVIPRGSAKTDWEVELGIVIAREAKYVSEEKVKSTPRRRVK